jgi:hypothetical protein
MHGRKTYQLWWLSCFKGSKRIMGLGDIQKDCGGEDYVMPQGPRPDFANSRVSQTFWPRTPIAASQPINQSTNRPTARPTDRSIYQSLYQWSNKINVVITNQHYNYYTKSRMSLLLSRSSATVKLWSDECRHLCNKAAVIRNMTTGTRCRLILKRNTECKNTHWDQSTCFP